MCISLVKQKKVREIWVFPQMLVKCVIKLLQSGIYSDRRLFRESIKCTKIPYVIQKKVAEPWKILSLQFVNIEEYVTKSCKFYIP